MSLRKFTLIGAASAVAILAAGPVMAADNIRGTTLAQAEVQSTTQIKADTLVGKDLKNLRGDKIGEIDAVIVGEDGKVAAVIVGVGGFLGMGEREVAIDWSDFQIRGNGDDLQTNMTKNDLKSLPEYKYEKSEYRKTAFRDGRYADMRDRRDATMDRKAGQMERKAEWIASHGVRTSKLIGANVVNSEGDTIGEVEDLMLSDGQPQLILSVGEFLGMGGHDVAIDLDKVKLHQQRGDADDVRGSVSITKDQLKAMPKFDLDAWKKRSNQL